MLIFKIVPRGEWERSADPYPGSAHDHASGFLHFSTAPQLDETLRLYYAGQTDLLLIAVDTSAVALDLKFEHAPSRGEDFPHLFAALPHASVRWIRPIDNDGVGFVLPLLD
jgi:uncharacterized protein (DUF952 family)